MDSVREEWDRLLIRHTGLVECIEDLSFWSDVANTMERIRELSVTTERLVGATECQRGRDPDGLIRGSDPDAPSDEGGHSVRALDDTAGRRGTSDGSRTKLLMDFIIEKFTNCK